MSIFGWLSSILFIICGIPQAIHCYKVKNSNGMDWTFIITWLLGEVFGIIYILDFMITPWPLFFNYFISLLSTIVILYYKVIGEKRRTKKLKSNVKVSKKRLNGVGRSRLYKEDIGELYDI